MLCKDGKISVYCFLNSSLVFLSTFLITLYFNIVPKSLLMLCIIPAVFITVNILLIRLKYQGKDFQIAIRATFLGTVVSLGTIISIYATTISIFGYYMIIMAIFHYSEFLTIAIIHPETLSTDTFMLNHSIQYNVAAISSWIEFFIESYFFPMIKTYYWISYLGIVICICGEIIRKVAMLTASSNFNHLVQNVKADGHELVTHGIYAFCRHPSYVGWFYWSIGTQIILLNPICMVAYTIASWLFFNQRIYIEEITLLNFFGQQYCDYQQKVSSGLPFIKGYCVKP